jgi:beta-barrel assembly-enhancing protease
MATPFIPKEVDSEVNVRPTERITDMLALFTAAFIILFLLLAGSVFVVQLAATRVSPKTESNYFSWLSKGIQGHEIRDQEMQAFVTKLTAQQKSYDIRVTISCDGTPNAVALPGGGIVLNKGLLEEIKTEEGMAFVLAHEMGHLVQRHHMRGLSMGFLQIVLSWIFPMDTVAVWGLLEKLFTSAYSREQEATADLYALKVMKKLYGDVQGAEEFFENIKNHPQEKFHRALWLTSSHPVTEDRIQTIKNHQLNEERKELTQTSLFSNLAQKICN